MHLLNHCTTRNYENNKIVQTAVVLCEIMYTFLHNRGLYEASTEESLTGARANSLFFPSCWSETGDLNHIKLWKWSRSKSVACPSTTWFWFCRAVALVWARLAGSATLHSGIHNSWVFCASFFSTYFFLTWQPDRIHKVTQEEQNANSVVFERKKTIETY